VTCFSDSEENTVGKSHLVPFLPEARLRELGGLYEKVGASHGAFNNVHRRPLSTDLWAI
jgi:hypothetical protein